MIDKEEVAAVLELIRPSLQADGGDVRLIEVQDDGTVVVELVGACKGCICTAHDKDSGEASYVRVCKSGPVFDVDRVL